MSADHKGDPTLEASHAYPSETNDFVVPEPDGVQSGVPFHGVDGVESGSQQTHRHQTVADHPIGETRDRRTLRGMSLKRKLNLSLGLLTLVILLLGLVSVRTLHQITAVGIPELGNHADLARLSEEIKTSIFRITLAQGDYLLLDDQGARERVLRLAAQTREKVEHLRVLSERILSSEGNDIGAQQRAIAEALDEFESRFAAQLKVVTDLRQGLADQISAQTATEQALASRLDSTIEIALELSADAWSEQGDGGPGQVALGRAIDGLTRDLLADRVAMESFFSSHSSAFIDIARTNGAEMIAQMERLRSDAANLGLGEKLLTLKKALVVYVAQLRETGTSMTSETDAQSSIAARIRAERDNLTEAGNRVLVLAEALTATAWHDIDLESAELAGSGGNAVWLVASAALIGFAVGLLVLLTIPKPITTAIEQLMSGAQQVARGNLTYSVDVASRDELGALADSFNQMRENLLTLVQRIQRASVQLSSSINEIQAATTEQAASSTEQASAVNQLSASLNEMSQSASTLGDIFQTVGHNVNDIAGIVTTSNQKSTQMMGSMDAIGLSTRQTAERIKALNDKMDDITEAVSTISMVADQTTLLSLNASIEANKAGEMGKGFSVVAQEIRRLSDRSIDSAGNISAMVRDIQRATESSAIAMDKSSEEIHHGVALVGETNQALDAIHESMERIQEQVTMILESVRAQAESVRMVQTTSTQMLSSANMVSKAATQTRAVTYELNAMAAQLASAVSVFRV